MAGFRHAKLRCSKCYKKYYKIDGERRWNGVKAVRMHGEYVLCMCQCCGHTYMSQSRAAHWSLESQKKPLSLPND